jgi:hypothetical protein
MFIQQPKNDQTLHTTYCISATCVTTVKSMDVVTTVSIIKIARPRQRTIQMRARLGSASFMTVHQTTTKTGKINTRGSADLVLSMKKLLGRETPLVLNVIQVLHLHKRAMGLHNTLYFRVQETQYAWFKHLSFCCRFGEGMRM